MKKEELIKLGLTEEQAGEVLKINGLDIEKYKSNNEKLTSDLKEAKDTIDSLQKNNKDNEKLQQDIEDYKVKLETAEKERVKTTKEMLLKEAISGAGGKDFDYLKFKLGDVELDKDGNIKDLDNKLKSLKENHPSFFNAEEPAEDVGGDTKNGFDIIDNKLNPGGKLDENTKVANEFAQALG